MSEASSGIRRTRADTARANKEHGVTDGTRLDHAGIDVADFEAQVQFYCQAFAFGIDQRSTLAKYNFTYALLRHEAGWGIELFKRDGAGPRAKSADPDHQHDRLGLGHVCFSVPDVQAMYDHLISLGAASLIPPGPSPVPEILFAYLIDPEGNLIELIQPAATETP